MKYLTFVVPCFNSQDYMERCVNSLLAGGEDVEIIIIDDGSTDRTGEIADFYETCYSGIVKAVHKKNGGHGSGVNKGLALAQGLYFKVVDSDDWLEEEAYINLLEEIKEHFSGRKKEKQGGIPDLYVCNYIYDHLEKGISRAIRYRNVFSEKHICGWNDLGHFLPSQYLVLHALVFRTEVLRVSGVTLPEHTFYVDNLFACQPLPLVERICYLDVDLYHYYLGRAGQSVNERVMMRQIDQQIYVTELVSCCVDLARVREKYPKLEKYMCRNISVMLAISSIHLLLINTREAKQKLCGLWDGIKQRDKRLYYRLRYRTLSGWTYLPGPLGAKIAVGGYRIARKFWRFQ